MIFGDEKTEGLSTKCRMDLRHPLINRDLKNLWGLSKKRRNGSLVRAGSKKSKYFFKTS